MDKKTDTGGSAFPNPKYQRVGDVVESQAEGGMSLRDYFAAAALPALINLCKGLPDDYPHNRGSEFMHIGGPGVELGDAGNSDTWAGTLAWEAYGVADAMIKERNKP